MTLLPRKTIKKEITFSGISLHKGLENKVTLYPANNKNITIRRKDLGTSFTLQHAKAINNQLSSSLGTTEATAETVEHLFATLHAFSITDLLIEMNAPELPIVDGSALPFAKAILEAGTENLNESYQLLETSKPIILNDQEKSIMIEPFPKIPGKNKLEEKISQNNTSHQLIIDYEINFPHPMIEKQKLKYNLNPESFTNEIAPARTFGFYKDLDKLKEMGLARGASLENVIALDEKNILNPEGLRFQDEFVRHKILDLIGDLFLKGIPVTGSIHAKYAGHALHQKLLEQIYTRQNKNNFFKEN